MPSCYHKDAKLRVHSYCLKGAFCRYSILNRLLAIQKDGTWYSAPTRPATQGSPSQVCSGLGGWLLKPHPAYGLVTSTGSVTQPLQWSSEYADTDLALVYYNYRHYNPLDGRWCGRDILQSESSTQNKSYAFCNNIFCKVDMLGLVTYWSSTANMPLSHDPLPPSNRLSYGNGAFLYFFGNGEPFIVDLKECASVVNRAAFGVDPCDEKTLGKNPIDRNLDLYSAENMDIAGPGRINAHFSYNITREGKKWTLEGTFTADPDEFDFNKRPHGERDSSWPYLKEWVTYFISHFPGTVFTVTFRPYTIREEGECPCEKQ